MGNENKKETIFISVSLFIIILLSFGAGWMMGKNSNNDSLIVERETEENENNDNAAIVLQKDNTSINEFVGKYYEAKANGDINMISSLIDNFPENEKLWTRELSKYVENITVSSSYTLPGLTEDSFVVYPYLETKFVTVQQVSAFTALTVRK